LLEAALPSFLDHVQVITDPWFYAVAIPAVLLTGVSKSGFASGFGALATPMLAMTVPVPQAAAIMLPLLLAMDATGLQQLWKVRDRALVAALVPWGIAGTLVGTALFGVFSTAAVSGVVGLLTLLFLAQRLLFPPHAASNPPAPWVGRACATASGFTSFVAHAGSPPIAAYLLPMKLAPAAFSGTMAVYFGALNLFKVLPYALLGLIDARNIATALLLLPLTPIGVWAGVRLTHRVSPSWFYRLAYGGMLLTGLKLLWDGLK
jgi:uncharacterized membrane protein YfcA